MQPVSKSQIFVLLLADFSAEVYLENEKQKKKESEIFV